MFHDPGIPDTTLVGISDNSLRYLFHRGSFAELTTLSIEDVADLVRTSNQTLHVVHLPILQWSASILQQVSSILGELCLYSALLGA